MNSTAKHVTRPFHFMVVFWGERYRDYFTELFLPSMLAPNNLPLLQEEDRHRFFMATPSQDWQAIKELPIMHRLRRHAEPSWVEVDAPREEKARDEHTRYAAMLQHMKLCERAVLEAGYHKSAYGSFHAPDTILSDGMVATLLRCARAGSQLVLCPVLRQSEESVISDLHAQGLLTVLQRSSVTARELTIPPRVVADLAVRHLHPEMAIFEEGAAGQPTTPPFRYWRVPDGRGIILHTFFGLPVLMDFEVVPPDHTSCLDHDLFENVYINANFRNCKKVHVIRDSDELVILSLTPKAINHSTPISREQPRRSALRRQHDQLCSIRRSFVFYSLRNSEPVKRQLFHMPVRWHANELDEVWRKQERSIQRLLKRAVGDYYRESTQPRTIGMIRQPRLNWRNLVLDVPVFDLPAVIRGLLYRRVLRAFEFWRKLRA